MKILIVGAAGDVGRAICCEFEGRHEIITAGRSSGDMKVDLTDENSVAALYRELGSVDAVVSAVGDVRFERLADMTSGKYLFGLQQKVLGQINLVLKGLDIVSDGGSFTLTSGILDRDPVLKGSGAAICNGALAGFVASAAIDMPRGLRVNVVSPGLLDVSADRYGSMFPGHPPVSSRRVGQAYTKCVEGAGTGQVVTVD